MSIITSKRKDSSVLWEILNSHMPAYFKRGSGQKHGRYNLNRGTWQQTAHQPLPPTPSWAKARNPSLHLKPSKGGLKVSTARVCMFAGG